MGVDDHAIDSLRVWFDIEFEELVEEWKSGQYVKLEDCPSYKAANTYRDAINVLVKGCYLPNYIPKYLMPTLKQQIKDM